MQVHCRRSLITVMLNPPCQGNSMRSTILGRPFSWCISLLYAVSTLESWRAGISLRGPLQTHRMPRMLRASCRRFCKQAATTRSRLPPPLR